MECLIIPHLLISFSDQEHHFGPPWQKYKEWGESILTWLAQLTVLEWSRLWRQMEMAKVDNANPTPQEWRTATDYALMLGGKMQKASEPRTEEKKPESPSKPSSK
jgi:hypothetical protein